MTFATSRLRHVFNLTRPSATGARTTACAALLRNVVVEFPVAIFDAVFFPNVIPDRQLVSQKRAFLSLSLVMTDSVEMLTYGVVFVVVLITSSVVQVRSSSARQEQIERTEADVAAITQETSVV